MNRNELIEFLKQIGNEKENQYISYEDEDKIVIRQIINNLILNPDAYFDGRYDKRKGDFGLHHFLFIPYYMNSIQKNSKTYYYPNERCEGYGLKVHCQEIDNHHFCCKDIFDPNGQWCIAYSNLSRSRISYRIPNVQPDQFLYNNRRYSLLFQCKVKISEILSEKDDNIILNNENYVIPYRLIKEDIDQ